MLLIPQPLEIGQEYSCAFVIKNLKHVLKMYHKTSYLKFNYFICMAAVDVPNYIDRFKIYYILSNFQRSYIQFVIQTNELTPLESITEIYLAANWNEREIWDLFGIFFYDNSDLRHILLDYGFSGHPLRKDFPSVGFLESFYDDSIRKIVHKKIQLVQEFRCHYFNYNW